MIDHVGISLPSLAEGRRFYGRALELLGYPGEPAEGGGFVEWDDFAIGEATDDRPVTRRLHIGFYAPSREAVDAWWRDAHRRGLRERRRSRATARLRARTTTAPSSSIRRATASRR